MFLHRHRAGCIRLRRGSQVPHTLHIPFLTGIVNAGNLTRLAISQKITEGTKNFVIFAAFCLE